MMEVVVVGGVMNQLQRFTNDCLSLFHKYPQTPVWMLCACATIQMIQSKRRRRRRRRATRHLNTSANLGSWHRKNTCVQLHSSLKWKSKEMIWHHWNWNIWRVPTFYFIIFHRLQSARGSVHNFGCVSHSHSSSCRTPDLGLLKKPIFSQICLSWCCNQEE